MKQQENRVQKKDIALSIVLVAIAIGFILMGLYFKEQQVVISISAVAVEIIFATVWCNDILKRSSVAAQIEKIESKED